jgi:hypothetical protein
MEKFLMNVYGERGWHHTVETNVLHFDTETEHRVVECAGIFYVCDCEGDAQQRGSYIPLGLASAPHAFALLEFLRLESLYGTGTD